MTQPNNTKEDCLDVRDINNRRMLHLSYPSALRKGAAEEVLVFRLMELLAFLDTRKKSLAAGAEFEPATKNI